MSKRISKKKLKKLNRYYMIVKIFMMVTPFIAYLYLSLLAMTRSITLPEVLSSEPSVAIIFLIAMINPYIAYLLGIAQRKLNEGDIKFACINFVLLLLAQALTLNSLYFMIVACLFYVTIKTYDIKVFKTLKEFTIKHIFQYGGGSFIVVAFSTICLFATLRLM